MLIALLKTMRPKQWPKNAFIFAALVFDRQFLTPEPLGRTIVGFILFSLAASTVYIINDIADIEQDRRHPKKKNRPLAAGVISPNSALIAGLVIGVLVIWASFLLGTIFGGITLGYVVLNLAYSFRLKHIPIIDVLVIASGFVMRVGAGVSLINVERFSPWLYVCTTLLALFIGFGKRRAELSLLAQNANSHRKVLEGYTLALLDQLIVIVSAATIMAYSLYTFSAENLPDNHLMMLTIPFVIYGIFRYLYLIHVEGAGGAPDEVLFTDQPFLATIILWGLLAASILYFGQ
jgi:4-hydroxybenzoate polyprenyltransferase